MLELITGFGSVTLIILVGWLVGRLGTLGPNAGYVLSMAVVWIATPALLFGILADTNPASLFHLPLAVAALSALLTAAVYLVIGRLFLNKRGAPAVIGALASSYSNAGNLGIPIAIAVLKDSSAVVPVMLFQIAFYAPVTLAYLDIVTAKSERMDLRKIITTPFANPILLAALAGMAWGFSGIALPQFVKTPIDLLAGAMVPMALLAFGISLASASVLERGVSPRRAVVVSSALKIVVMPLIAYVLAHFAFGMRDDALLAAVTMAALPTAQNVFNYATRYNIGTVGSRDAGVLTTVACLPALLLIAFLLG